MSEQSWADVRTENAVQLAPMLGRDVMEMQKIARSLHKLDEANYNYGLTPHQEANERRLEQRAAAIAKEHRAKVYRQGDPRGWPLLIYTARQLNKYIARWPEEQRKRLTIDSCSSSVGECVCPR